MIGSAVPSTNRACGPQEDGDLSRFGRQFQGGVGVESLKNCFEMLLNASQKRLHLPKSKKLSHILRCPKSEKLAAECLKTGFTVLRATDCRKSVEKRCSPLFERKTV